MRERGLGLREKSKCLNGGAASCVVMERAVAERKICASAGGEESFYH
jgi:hypothetical protein